MSIPVQCDACGKRYQIKEKYAGRLFECKECGFEIVVPKSAPQKIKRPEPRLTKVSRKKSKSQAGQNAFAKEYGIPLGIGSGFLLLVLVILQLGGDNTPTANWASDPELQRQLQPEVRLDQITIKPPQDYQLRDIKVYSNERSKTWVWHGPNGVFQVNVQADDRFRNISWPNITTEPIKRSSIRSSADPPYILPYADLKRGRVGNFTFTRVYHDLSEPRVKKASIYYGPKTDGGPRYCIYIAFDGAHRYEIVGSTREPISSLTMDIFEAAARSLRIPGENEDIAIASLDQSSKLPPAFRGQNLPKYMKDRMTVPGPGQNIVVTNDKFLKDSGRNSQNQKSRKQNTNGQQQGPVRKPEPIPVRYLGKPGSLVVKQNAGLPPLKTGQTQVSSVAPPAKLLPGTKGSGSASKIAITDVLIGSNLKPRQGSRGPINIRLDGSKGFKQVRKGNAIISAGKKINEAKGSFSKNGPETKSSVGPTIKVDPQASIPLEESHSSKIHVGIGDYPYILVDGVHFNPSTGKKNARVERGVKSNRAEYIPGPDGKICLIIKPDEDIHAAIVSSETGETIDRFRFSNSNFEKLRINQIQLLDTSRMLIAASFAPDYYAIIYDYKAKQILHEIPISVFEDAALSPDGNMLAICTWHDLAIYDLNTGKTMAVLETPKNPNIHLSGCENIEFSPDGMELAGCFREWLVCWNARAKIIEEVRFPREIRNLRSYDGETMKWLPDQSGWLLAGKYIFERKTKMIVWQAKHPNTVSAFYERMPTALLGPEHLLVCTGPKIDANNRNRFDAGHTSTIPIPWSQIRSGLTALQSQNGLFLQANAGIKVDAKFETLKFPEANQELKSEFMKMPLIFLEHRQVKVTQDSRITLQIRLIEHPYRPNPNLSDDRVFLDKKDLYKYTMQLRYLVDGKPHPSWIWNFPKSRPHIYHSNLTVDALRNSRSIFIKETERELHKQKYRLPTFIPYDVKRAILPVVSVVDEQPDNTP